ncbi:hypothetical protein [Streptomyces decoyicus]|uniref:hypothetical protein n=1 Tax=Streptomyces decoyicus TaxID=249567 RepID=UPI00386840DF
MSDFWDAASAIAITAATGVALGVALFEVVTRRKEQTDGQAAQARLVVSVIRGTSAEVTNHSSEPLLELRVIRADAESHGNPVAVRWPEDEQRIFYNVAPGQALLLELMEQGWGDLIDPELGYAVGPDPGIAPSGSTNIRLTVQFLDAAGLWWQRVGLRPPTRVVGEASEPVPNSD